MITIYLDTSRNIYSFIINYRRLWRWYFHELSPQLEESRASAPGQNADTNLNEDDLSCCYCDVIAVISCLIMFCNAARDTHITVSCVSRGAPVWSPLQMLLVTTLSSGVRRQALVTGAWPDDPSPGERGATGEGWGSQGHHGQYHLWSIMNLRY